MTLLRLDMWGTISSGWAWRAPAKSLLCREMTALSTSPKDPSLVSMTSSTLPRSATLVLNFSLGLVLVASLSESANAAKQQPRLPSSSKCFHMIIDQIMTWWFWWMFELTNVSRNEHYIRGMGLSSQCCHITSRRFLHQIVILQFHTYILCTLPQKRHTYFIWW